MLDPIIDNSRDPISRLRRARTPGATVRILWLAILRPLLLLLVWLITLDYLYWEFVKAVAASPSDARFLRLCGLAVLGLFGVMLIVARAVRDRETRENRRFLPAAAIDVRRRNLAAAAHVAERDLRRWQGAKKMVALHDEEGHFRKAVVQPSASQPPMLKPDGPPPQVTANSPSLLRRRPKFNVPT